MNTGLRGPPRFSAPLFRPSIWSIFETNANGIPRTQNNIEAWHRRWNSLVGASHVGILKILKFIKDEQKTVQVNINKYANSSTTSNLMNKPSSNEIALQTIINNRAQKTLIEYLNSLTHHFSY